MNYTPNPYLSSFAVRVLYPKELNNIMWTTRYWINPVKQYGYVLEPIKMSDTLIAFNYITIVCTFKAYTSIDSLSFVVNHIDTLHIPFNKDTNDIYLDFRSFKVDSFKPFDPSEFRLIE